MLVCCGSNTDNVPSEPLKTLLHYIILLCGAAVVANSIPKCMKNMRLQQKAFGRLSNDDLNSYLDPNQPSQRLA